MVASNFSAHLNDSQLMCALFCENALRNGSLGDRFLLLPVALLIIYLIYVYVCINYVNAVITALLCSALSAFFTLYSFRPGTHIQGSWLDYALIWPYFCSIWPVFINIGWIRHGCLQNGWAWHFLGWQSCPTSWGSRIWVRFVPQLFQKHHVSSPKPPNPQPPHVPFPHRMRLVYCLKLIECCTNSISLL